jgi:hypothetical protein
MPRAPARIRKRYIEGTTDVLDWELEEILLYGVPLVFGPPPRFKTVDDWARDWARWRDVILPKCIEHRPGTRPFAMYAVGEIPRRELTMPLPQPNGFWHVDVREHDGSTTTHYLNVPEPWVRAEAMHLRDHGIISADELRRHRAWMRQRNPDCSSCAVDSYPLEMSLYE